MVSEPRASRPPSLTPWLLRCGLVAGPSFLVVFTADGATRPGYRPLRHPVSSLSLGPRGRVQVTNFAVTGALFLAAGAGLTRAAGPERGSKRDARLLEVAGMALLGSAVFATDPVSGYPAGSPDALSSPTITGTLHNLCGAGVFLGLPAAAAAAGWRALRQGRPGWAAYCAGTAATMLTAAIAAGAGFSQSPRLVNVAGLCQRVAIVTGFGWVSVRSGRALRQVTASGTRPAGR
jgi:hypothetical protein